MSARSRLLAALAAFAVLAVGVIGVVKLIPAPAEAAAPISTIAPTAAAAAGPVLAGPVADFSAARDAGQRVTAVAAEREAAEQEPTLTCEPSAAARLVGNIIVNKNCPALNAAKEAAQRDWGCQQGYIVDGCSGVNGPKPSESEQRKRIADGSVPQGGGYQPGSAEYRTCSKNPVAAICGG